MGHHVNSARMNDGVISMNTSIGEKVGKLDFSGKNISDARLLRAYKNSWLTKKFINDTADDMLKIPREINGDITEEKKVEIEDLEQKLNARTVFWEALTWASLLGDALIVAVTDCADDSIHTPLNLASEDIVRFLIFKKGEYKAGDNIIKDLSSPHFGQPETYKISIGSDVIEFHQSRCHRTRLGKFSVKETKKYGESDIQAAYTAIMTFEAAVTATGDTIQEANVDVLFVEGLNMQIAAGEEQKVIEYAQVMKSVKSSTGMLLIDAGDEGKARYEQKNAQFGGLAEVITKLANVVAGALDRPLTRLFGLSASGFSSGEEDNKSYYESINKLQEARLRPMQDFVDQFILDKLTDVSAITYIYPSIGNTNKTEDSQVFTQYATGYTSLVTAGVVTEEMALRELMARGVVTTVTEEDVNNLAEVSIGQWRDDSETDAGEGEKEI